MGCGSSTPEDLSNRKGDDIRTEVAKGDNFSIENASYDARKVLLKVILLGNSGVGKTSLMQKWVTQRFNQIYKATIGADFLTKKIEIDGKAVTMQIWDTAGQERYESLGSAFYRGADACVLTFDVTNRESFERLCWWRDKFMLNSKGSSRRLPDNKSPPAFFVLLANKIDLEERVVTSEEIVTFCEENGGIQYFEVSAKEGINVDSVFRTIAVQSLKDISYSSSAGDFEQ